MILTVNLSKDSFKFSSSHFTIFSDSKAESLHGHNYYVTVQVVYSPTHKEIEESNFITSDFKLLKSDIKNICDQIDEKILIPQTSNFLTIKKELQDKPAGVWIHLGLDNDEKKYYFPLTDTCFLPVSNITCEALSFYIASELQKSWNFSFLKDISVTVQETKGQAVTTTLHAAGANNGN